MTYSMRVALYVACFSFLAAGGFYVYRAFKAHYIVKAIGSQGGGVSMIPFAGLDPLVDHSVHYGISTDSFLVMATSANGEIFLKGNKFGTEDVPLVNDLRFVTSIWLDDTRLNDTDLANMLVGKTVTSLDVSRNPAVALEDCRYSQLLNSCRTLRVSASQMSKMHSSVAPNLTDVSLVGPGVTHENVERMSTRRTINRLSIVDSHLEPATLDALYSISDLKSIRIANCSIHGVLDLHAFRSRKTLEEIGFELSAGEIAANGRTWQRFAILRRAKLGATLLHGSAVWLMLGSSQLSSLELSGELDSELVLQAALHCKSLHSLSLRGKVSKDPNVSTLEIMRPDLGVYLFP